MKRLNEYTKEQLDTLEILIQVGIMTANEDSVENKFHRQASFWKGEVKQAQNDLEFENSRLKF